MDDLLRQQNNDHWNKFFQKNPLSDYHRDVNTGEIALEKSRFIDEAEQGMKYFQSRLHAIEDEKEKKSNEEAKHKITQD